MKKKQFSKEYAFDSISERILPIIGLFFSCFITEGIKSQSFFASNNRRISYIFCVVYHV